MHAVLHAQRGEPAADEKTLITLVKGGDPEAFNELVRRYLRRATAMARRLLQDDDDAEDVVQDAFLRALRRIERCDEQRGFGPWFFRLLFNTALNARRSRGLRRHEPEDETAAATNVNPERLLLRAEIRSRFRDALAKLSSRQRLIVSMVEVDGFSTAEIAKSLDITPETVRWHHHRARLVLREALRDLREPA
jgi:RNA polymerase sigma-70 factor (ECF subfamily)